MLPFTLEEMDYKILRIINNYNNRLENQNYFLNNYDFILRSGERADVINESNFSAFFCEKEHILKSFNKDLFPLTKHGRFVIRDLGFI